MGVQLSFLVQYSEKECIQATMPSSFKNKYPNCRVFIDCTEISLIIVTCVNGDLRV